MTGWKTAGIESFCTVGAGGTPPRDSIERYYEGGTIPWVKSGELRERTIFDTEEHITEVALRETNLKMIPAGALLLAMYGATVGRLGTLGVPATSNQAVCHIIPDPTVAEVRYLFHALRNQVSDLVARGVGGAQPNISQGVVKGLSVPLPPLPEQRRIAEILDKADAVRAKRRAALAQLDALAQAILVDMFGDPTTNPKGWPHGTLGDFIKVGPQNGLYRPATDYGAGTPILRIDAFYDGVVTKLASLKRVRLSEQELATYALREGEIVINRVNSREYLGKSALIPALTETVVFESNMMRFDIDRNALDPNYLIQYLQTGFVRSHISRSTKDAVNQSSINQQDVKAIPLVLPPIAKQRHYAHRLSAIDRLKGAHRASGAGLDLFFASLQHRAFGGERSTPDLSSGLDAGIVCRGA